MKRFYEGVSVWPGACWLLVFFAVPLGIIAVISFTQRDLAGLIRWEFTLDNYLRLLERSFWVGPLGNSVALAVLTTVICLVLGYPLAYVLARSPTRRKHLLLFLVVLPSFTNFLVRIYAWFILLRPEGWLSWGLRLLGIEANLFGSWVGVLIGLVYGYLPFMILPLYATLERLDYALVEAAYDLGGESVAGLPARDLPLEPAGDSRRQYSSLLAGAGGVSGAKAFGGRQGPDDRRAH
jgi:spermidine/putrescine transport system permease protein